MAWVKLDDATIDRYAGAEPLPAGRDCLPFADLPLAKQLEIGELVRNDSPPPKWMSVGLAEIVSRAWYEWYWSRGIDPEARRQKISARVRERVIRKSDGWCGICGDPLTDLTDIHIDHIVPRSKGGSDHISNLQAAHPLCNLKKGATL